MALTITRAGPMTTLQDAGRTGMLKHGISASGPMDRIGFAAAGDLLATPGSTSIELAQSLSFTVDAEVTAAMAGGSFRIRINDAPQDWPVRRRLAAGDTVAIVPGTAGNYGYVRFDREIELKAVLGSRATNVAVGLGGLKGRALRAGDTLAFGAPGVVAAAKVAAPPVGEDGPLRVIWGIHADLFDAATRQAFVDGRFIVSNTLDRMGVRLNDPGRVFAETRRLTLVSDPIVPGDIQIVGDGVPVVLMRDHQPTGGYPRIATIAEADLDRFAQMRPGTEVAFRPVTLAALR